MKTWPPQPYSDNDLPDYVLCKEILSVTFPSSSSTGCRASSVKPGAVLGNYTGVCAAVSSSQTRHLISWAGRMCEASRRSV
ncbi:hypothetical protein Pcinc_043023 [Petrolisthes cinctipes]|uniref:Uncharacterized protein n=1 Tax=Petrolisthes cinctipes TaxID=88211 RepID=A0AAE1EFD6_PETCI|nr:hypothetical protein Pcinc_043023 [Petrolisthes cinctipes]